jgi:hypothetical protein
MIDNSYFLPRIAPRDYETFRDFIHPHAPNTYDEWADLMMQRRNEFARRGFDIVEVNVNPNEFTSYCASTGEARDLAALARFVEGIATRNKY